MEKFISCDWGTSALRLRVIDINEKSVMAETGNAQGISATFNLWKQSGVKEDKRDSFYKSILAAQINKLEKQSDLSLKNVPLIISGMASSSIGMIELPYKEAPFSIDGHDLYIKILDASGDFNHTTLMISGVKTADDAMRGEETQLMGCIHNEDKKDQVFIFPGTHSKHVRIRDEKVADVKTYMTGEFFELLSKKSILSNNVEENKDLLNTDSLKGFERGVADSVDSNLLHNSFLVRTNQLFGKLSKQENYFYLSGLLIGSELKELINIGMPITIVSDEWMIKLYSSALQKLGVSDIKYQDAGKAILKGYCKIYSLYKSKLNTGHTLIKQ